MKNCDLTTPAVLNSLFVAYASSWVRRRKRPGRGGGVWGPVGVAVVTPT